LKILKNIKVLKRIFVAIGSVVFLLLLFPRCAKVVSPTGGPKDTLPPVLINSIPKINSTNFNGDKIVLEFDEYIKPKELQQKLLVSPPLKNRPIPQLKGKKLVLELLDTLKPNATYTFYFSDAIRDNNEDNPINNFVFAFSTGNEIDTLVLKGTITDAFTNKPVENALVMLYDKALDTLPYTTLPLHIAKTDKDGKFTAVNLKPTSYKVVAITDKNSDYLYNQGKEFIAFYDSLLAASAQNDSATAAIKMRMFTEELPNQILSGYDRPERYMLTLHFSRVPINGFKLHPIDSTSLTDWYIVEPDNNGDTLTLWISNSELAKRDTLMTILNYYKTDSLYRLLPQRDTLRFLYYEAEKQESTDDTLKKGFSLTTSIPGDKVVIPNIPVEFTLPKPALSVDSSKILIFNQTDSIVEPDVKLEADSINPRIYRFYKKWEVGKTYHMLVLPMAFTDIANQTNDTLEVKVNGADPEKFGTLALTLSGVKNKAVVELLNEKGTKVIATKIATENSFVKFDFIKPGKYQIRIIDDENGNGKWDTGNYMKHIQPERVFYYTDEKTKGIISIRANWDSELQYELKP
jgi:uncharacterized protein (DUF2141 family)